MNLLPHRRPPHPDQRRRPKRILGVLLAAVVTIGLTANPGTAGVARAGASGEVARAAASSLKSEIRAADDSLARARRQIRAHRYYRAVRSLERVTKHTRRVNVAAQALIGAPPTDPESDDPPGPPAVLAATRLDYRVSTGATALFDGQRRDRLVRQLRRSVATAQRRRDALLDAVIALPAEGDGADYADGMADTLGQYDREVETISAALTTFALTAPARIGLTNSLARAEATRAKVNKAFGGGERPIH